MRRPWWVHAPILGLALLAANHAQLVVRHDMSPWLGGGFGMFSAVDRRHVVAIHLGGDRAGEVIPLPNLLEDAIERAQAFPTPSRLEALALEISKGPEGCRAVRVEIWRTVVDPESFRPGAGRLAEVERTCPSS